jgi:UDP-N-acetylmuramate dehydrogenase
MARYTSWRVGGPARRFFEPADTEDLAAFMAGLPADESVFWFGLGSNLLVRDGGIAGTVIHTQRGLSVLDADSEGIVRAGAGVACAKVARFCGRRGLQGAEFLAGIPGTVGGALAMNAGAWGGETWEYVREVETLDRHGTIRRRRPQDYEVSYRSVRGPEGEWFTAATFVFRPGGDPVGLSERVRELLAQRGRTQPTGQASCGSVFRNPTGDHAARLIEATGLKGECIGGACVSEKHANFIINTGDATAADIEALIRLVQERVEAAQGVRLQPEVRIVGEVESNE